MAAITPPIPSVSPSQANMVGLEPGRPPLTDVVVEAVPERLQQLARTVFLTGMAAGPPENGALTLRTQAGEIVIRSPVSLPLDKLLAIQIPPGAPPVRAQVYVASPVGLAPVAMPVASAAASGAVVAGLTLLTAALPAPNPAVGQAVPSLITPALLPTVELLPVLPGLVMTAEVQALPSAPVQNTQATPVLPGSAKAVAALKIGPAPVLGLKTDALAELLKNLPPGLLPSAGVMPEFEATPLPRALPLALPAPLLTLPPGSRVTVQVETVTLPPSTLASTNAAATVLPAAPASPMTALGLLATTAFPTSNAPLPAPLAVPSAPLLTELAAQPLVQPNPVATAGQPGASLNLLAVPSTGEGPVPVPPGSSAPPAATAPLTTPPARPTAFASLIEASADLAPSTLPLAPAPVSAFAKPAMALSMPAAPSSPAPLPAEVIGHSPHGAALAATPAGLLVLPAAAALPVGATMELSVVEVAEPPLEREPLPLPVRQWPALQEGLNSLLQTQPHLVALVQNRLPQSAGLGGLTLLFMVALKLNDARGWLTAEGTDALAGTPGGLARILGEFGQNRLPEAPAPEGWKSFAIPLHQQGQLQQFVIHTRQEEAEASNGRETGQRILVELELTRLGPLQLDGLIRAKGFEMTMRSQRTMPKILREELRGVFHTALEAVGFHGGLQFETAAGLWLRR